MVRRGERGDRRIPNFAATVAVLLLCSLLRSHLGSGATVRSPGASVGGSFYAAEKVACKGLGDNRNNLKADVLAGFQSTMHTRVPPAHSSLQGADAGITEAKGITDRARKASELETELIKNIQDIPIMKSKYQRSRLRYDPRVCPHTRAISAGRMRLVGSLRGGADGGGQTVTGDARNTEVQSEMEKNQEEGDEEDLEAAEEEGEHEFLEDWGSRRQIYQKQIEQGTAKVTGDTEFFAFFKHDRMKQLQQEFETWKQQEEATEFERSDKNATALSYDKFDPIVREVEEEDRREKEAKEMEIMNMKNGSLLSDGDVGALAKIYFNNEAPYSTRKTPLQAFSESFPEMHKECINAFAWRFDGLIGASVGDDGYLSTWTQDGAKITTLSNAHEGERVLCVTWSPDGKYLATGGADNSMRIWNAETLEEVICMGKRVHKSWVMSVAWAPDKDMLVSGSDDGMARIWDTKRWSLLHVIDGHASSVTNTKWSPRESGILGTASADGFVKIWELDEGDCVQVLSLKHNESINALEWSPDGELLATCAFDGSCIIWEKNEEPALKFKAHEGGLSVHWTEAGDLVTNGLFDKNIKVWDVSISSMEATAELRSQMRNVVHVKSVSSRISQNATAELFLAAMNGTAFVWTLGMT